MKFFLILLLGTGFLLQGNDTLKENTIIDRKTGERFRESVMGDKALRFAYETLLGRSLWGILFNSSFLSDLMGKYYDSPASCKKIASLTAINLSVLLLMRGEIRQETSLLFPRKSLPKSDLDKPPSSMV